MRTSTILCIAGLVLSACNTGSGLPGDVVRPPGDDTDEEEVANDELLGLGISPNDPTLEIGDVLTLSVTAYYGDDSSEDITGDVSFASTDPRVATVDSTGRVEAFDSGTTRITATDINEVSTSVTVTVLDEEVVLDNLVLTPATVSLNIGDTVNLTVMASYSDGSDGNVSGSCDWSSSASSTATVDTRGGVSALNEGTATITASCDGTDLTASITVEAEDVDIGLPDLRITDASASVNGEDIVYTVDVENRGQAVASGFYVDGWLDKSSAPAAGDSDYDTFGWVSGLAPGETATVTLDLTGVAPGSYESWVFADTDGWIEEDDLSNNADGPISVTVEEQTLGPDLQVDYVEAIADWDDGIAPYTIYYVEITNWGDEPATDFYVDLFLDRYGLGDPAVCDYGDEWTQIDSLGPFETFYWEPEIPDAPDPDVDYFWDSVVFADSCDDVVEVEEINNLGEYTVYPE